MTIGTKVQVNLKGGHSHIGIFLGNDLMGMKIGILSTTVPGVILKPGKKFISVFYAKESQLEVLK